MEEIKRGNIVYVELPKAEGSTQGGARACLVIQNDMANKFSPVVIVSPITSKLGKKMLPTHVRLGVETGLKVESQVMLEQMITVPKEKIKFIIGHVGEKKQQEINLATLVSLGMYDIRTNTLAI